MEFHPFIVLLREELGRTEDGFENAIISCAREAGVDKLRYLSGCYDGIRNAKTILDRLFDEAREQ